MHIEMKRVIFAGSVSDRPAGMQAPVIDEIRVSSMQDTVFFRRLQIQLPFPDIVDLKQPVPVPGDGFFRIAVQTGDTAQKRPRIQIHGQDLLLLFACCKICFSEHPEDLLNLCTCPQYILIPLEYPDIIKCNTRPSSEKRSLYVYSYNVLINVSFCI